MSLGTPAGATPITPGMPDASLTSGALTGYTQIANTGAQTYNNCATNTPSNKHPTICGQYDEAVYRNNSNGTLDFVYQFSNGYAKAGVDTFSVSYFDDSAPATGWVTNAYYTNVEPAGFLGTPGCKYVVTGNPKVPVCNPSGVASLNITPATVNEAGDASTLSFNFSKGLESGFSSILIVQTTAKNYEPGGVAIQDSRNFNSFDLNLPGYQPAVPEPGFYGALAIGLAAIVWASTRRNKQRANESSVGSMYVDTHPITSR
jgi:hypothetical protein